MSFNLGFIGGGNMSSAIVQGILKNKSQPPSKIWVSGPRLQNLKVWSDLGTNVSEKNGEVVCNCDVIFLGVKPGLLHKVVMECRNSSPQDISHKAILVVSMLAGISIKKLHSEFVTLSDKVRIIRIMPNTPMAVGAGSCLYTPDESVSATECSLLETLLAGCGICERVPEDLINPLGCLTGCGPAFIYVVIEALADAAVKTGVPRRLALRHAAQLAAGSGQLVLRSGRHPAQLRDEVCSPGGSTICGINALEQGRIRATLMSAVEAALARTLQLGEQ